MFLTWTSFDSNGDRLASTDEPLTPQDSGESSPTSTASEFCHPTSGDNSFPSTLACECRTARGSPEALETSTGFDLHFCDHDYGSDAKVIWNNTDSGSDWMTYLNVVLLSAH